ncbi:MAG: hypothetical protein WD426_08575 [Anditalea sp.]
MILISMIIWVVKSIASQKFLLERFIPVVLFLVSDVLIDLFNHRF